MVVKLRSETESVRNVPSAPNDRPVRIAAHETLAGQHAFAEPVPERPQHPRGALQLQLVDSVILPTVGARMVGMNIAGARTRTNRSPCSTSAEIPAWAVEERIHAPLPLGIDRAVHDEKAPRQSVRCRN